MVVRCDLENTVIVIRRTIDSLRKRKKMGLTATTDNENQLELLDDGPNPFEALALKQAK